MVSSFNTGAKRLYERLGFSETGILKDYVIRGSDEYLMRKSICPANEFNTEYPWFDHRINCSQETKTP
jgi:RimJ/RimL family protein N-acetyltransferase